METDIWPTSERGYSLEFPIGKGTFGLVWFATVLEGENIGSKVAIKIIDLESYQHEGDLDEIRKEISAMADSDHPNIIKYYISFTIKSEVWLVMPMMRSSSVGTILDQEFRGGIHDEAIIATILNETLKGLDYFHQNGQIHRDIKA